MRTLRAAARAGDHKTGIENNLFRERRHLSRTIQGQHATHFCALSTLTCVLFQKIETIQLIVASISKKKMTRANPEKTTTKKDQEVCCPPFDSQPYEGQQITWKDKPFVKEWTYCIRHVPLNFGGAVLRGQAKLRAAGYVHEPASHEEGYLILSDCNSPFRSNVYLPVIAPPKEKDTSDTNTEEETKVEVPNAEMFYLSGTFLTKVFEGPYSNYCNFLAETMEYVKEQKPELKEPLHIYNFYPTCPKCSKKYGKNYVVILAQVAA